jgi:hypothetical protein
MFQETAQPCPKRKCIVTSLGQNALGQCIREQQVARRKTRIALRLDRVAEIKEAAEVYAETKIEELAELKLRLDKPELAQEWDKIQHRERQAAVSAIESAQKRRSGLARSLTLSRVVDKE